LESLQYFSAGNDGDRNTVIGELAYELYRIRPAIEEANYPVRV
jgi:hypothetical protein